MKTCFGITVVLLFCCANVIAQQETRNILLTKRVEKCLTFIKTNPPNGKTSSHSQAAMELGMLYAYMGAKDSAIWYLNSALDNCAVTNTECEEINDPNIVGFYHFKSIANTAEWKKFEKRITETYFRQNKIKDPVLALQLIKAGGLDQSVRILMRYDKEAMRKEIKKVDSMNLVFIRRVIKDNGYPGISQVGTSAGEAAFLLVQHADRDTTFQNKVLADMKKLLGKKDVAPENYALLTDRVMVNTQGKQLYGTQFEDVKTKKLYPIVDSVNVDKRRQAVGLSPLAEYVKSIWTF